MSKKKPSHPVVMLPGKSYKGSARVDTIGNFYFHPYPEQPTHKRNKFRLVTGKGSGLCSYLVERDDELLRIEVTVPLNIASPRTREEMLQNLFINALVALSNNPI